MDKKREELEKEAEEKFVRFTNKPENLPVLDLEGMKSEHGLHFNL